MENSIKAWGKCPRWLRQAKFVLLYTIIYLLCRKFSFHHWFLPAGVQLLALLLAPYSYWPVLALSSSMVALPTAMACKDQFGLLWAGLMLVPRVCLIMPLVYWGRLRKWLPNPPHLDRPILMTPLIGIAFCCALLIPLWNIMIFHAMPPLIDDPGWQVWLERFVLGHYLGILTIVPTGLFITHLLTQIRSTRAKTGFGRNPTSTELLIIAVFITTLYFGIRFAANNDITFILRLGLLFPIGCATIRYGWGGAALSGTLSNITLANLAPAAYDLPTMQAEIFIGFAMTVFLMLGAKISLLDAGEAQEKAKAMQAIDSGRRFQQQTELRFQRIGEWMLETSQAVQQAQQQVNQQLYYRLQPAESLSLQNHALLSQLQFRQLVEDIAPPSSIDEMRATHFGGLSWLFQCQGITWHSHVHGDLKHLPPSLKSILYRLVTETSAYLASQPEAYDYIKVKIRGIGAQPPRAIALRIEAKYALDTRIDTNRYDERLKKMQRISSTGPDLTAIEHLAQLYQGRLRRRGTPHTQLLSLLLRDTPTCGTLSTPNNHRILS